MGKEKTMAEMLNELERAAKELERDKLFHGEYSGIACVFAAGMKMLIDKQEQG